MFLRRQDVANRFGASFHTNAEGQIIFQHPRSFYGAPVSPEEYDAVMAAFERHHRVAIAVNWAVFVSAMIYGIYRVLAFGDYTAALIAGGIAFAVSFAVGLGSQVKLVAPFAKRRDELRAEDEDEDLAAL